MAVLRSRRNLAVLIACAALLLSPFGARAQDDDDDDEEEDEGPRLPDLGLGDVTPKGEALYFETFSNGKIWEGSKLAKYNGKMRLGSLEGQRDQGMYVPNAARHYGHSAKTSGPISIENGLVLQFELALLDGLDCGGAYLKFLSYDPDFTPATMTSETPYSIMFGPDKCGENIKVHAIFRHKSPKTGEIEEKHLKSGEMRFPLDKKSHLYTMIVYKTGEVEVLIDGDIRAQGKLHSDFEPAFDPPKTIDDPEDKKPEDWVENAKIPDPAAAKPEEWDEDAPKMIPDMEAEMPEGWLLNEQEIVDDPDAEVPADWDVDEDGAWDAPKIENPLCDDAPGCGPWERPMKYNPVYLGRWAPKLIDNPEYKGEWKPQKIDNPLYHHDPAPLLNVAPIGGVAVEIWTMTRGLLFDNILIAADEEVAEDFADRTWQLKHDAQVELEDALRPQKKDATPPFLIEQMRILLDKEQFRPFAPVLFPMLAYCEKRPLVLYAIIGFAPVAIVLLANALCCRKDDGEDEEEEDEDEEPQAKEQKPVGKSTAVADGSQAKQRKSKRAA